jgi:hypothetical protein
MLSPYPPTGPYVRPSAISSQQPQSSSALNPNSISLFVELQTLIIMFSNSTKFDDLVPFFLIYFFFPFGQKVKNSLFHGFFLMF